MEPRAICALPGCLSFEYAGRYVVRRKLFVRTDHALLANRIAGRVIPAEDVPGVLETHLTANYPVVEAYSKSADDLIPGNATREEQLACLMALKTKA